MTVKALIIEHINELLIPKQKGINLKTYEDLSPGLRNNIKLLNGQREFRAAILKKVLKDKGLLEIVNSLPTSDEVELAIDEILESDRNLDKVKEVLRSQNIIELTKEIREVYKEVRKNRYSVQNNLGNTIIDVYRFYQTYTEGNWNLKGLIETIALDHNYKKFESDTESLEYLRFTQYNYLSLISSEKMKHFNNNKEDFEFFQYLFDITGDEFLTYYKPFRKLIRTAENKHDLKEKVQQLLGKFDKEVINTWLSQIILHEYDTITEHEVNRMLRAEGTEDDIYAVIYGESSPAYSLLSKIKGTYLYEHRNLVKKAIIQKKKAFLRLLSQDKMFSIYRNMSTNNILLNGLFERVNVNTLNESNLKAAETMYDNQKIAKIPTDTLITFNEFEALYGASDMHIKVFYKLMDMSVEQRLKAFRELPALGLLTKLFNTEEEVIDRVANLIKHKPFKTIIREKGINIPGAKDEQLLAVLVAPEKFGKFLGEIRSGSDVQFIVNNQELLPLADSLDTLKALFVKRDPQTQFMIKETGLSKEFISNNLSRIISFHDRGLVNIFHRIHEVNKQSKDQLHNLALLTKAELSGKLKDIKFVDDDFELEIGLPVSEQTKHEWKENRSNKVSKFLIQEAYDYETTINIGENPVRSCLSWNDGLYTRCLLSNFDTNKKILIAKDPKGNIVSRALLRLTKSTENPKKGTIEKRLGFKDIENEGVSNSFITEESIKEELVLFLEHSYTSLDTESKRSQASLVDAAFLELAKEKAKALGAKLVTSEDYVSDELEKVNTHIFISYSKNGYQYLDSLSGQATESNEGQYKSATVQQLKK